MREGGRRSIRLKMYDYRSVGYYFVTICTKDRVRLFGRIKKGEMHFSKFGKIAHGHLHGISKHFPNVVSDEFIIMPDHVHAIIHINIDVDQPPNGEGPDHGLGVFPCMAQSNPVHCRPLFVRINRRLREKFDWAVLMVRFGNGIIMKRLFEMKLIYGMLEGISKIM